METSTSEIALIVAGAQLLGTVGTLAGVFYICRQLGDEIVSMRRHILSRIEEAEEFLCNLKLKPPPAPAIVATKPIDTRDTTPAKPVKPVLTTPGERVARMQREIMAALKQEKAEDAKDPTIWGGREVSASARPPEERKDPVVLSEREAATSLPPAAIKGNSEDPWAIYKVW